MILKSYTRASTSFGQLAGYIAREGAVMKRNGIPYYIKHNILGRTVEEIEREYKDNEKNRRRQNGIRLYHDIISYRSADSERLSTDTIDKIARKYIELRNDKALYFGAAHEDKEHIHIHLMISSIEAYSGKSIRISKNEFKAVKMQLQEYEQELGLIHSQVEHGKGERTRKYDEYQLGKAGRVSRKDEIRQVLQNSFDSSLSREEFYENVQQGGLKFYERGGKISGIEDRRRHRLQSLNYGEEKLAELDRRAEKLAEIQGVSGGQDNVTEVVLDNPIVENNTKGIEDLEQESEINEIER
ncbi:MAG: relaxase/mobilization nuclease domain-containing protein [Bacteroidetes bacterium]|nr:relaxase/mobilization nuclease domain-containing protein [Bacteroidota bacterium]